MKITHRIETYTALGEPVLRFRVVNGSGSYLEFTNFGARWIAAVLPDAKGLPANVLVGYGHLDDYLNDPYYMGATIGRFANRIANASFTLDGRTYVLDRNDGIHTNHGGYSGFHQKVWEWEELADGVRFHLCSPDGEGGYPGRVSVTVDYRFSDSDELTVRHRAVTDRSTYVNLTNHAYFNLNGGPGTVKDHRLSIFSDKILETTSDFIPTGGEIEVAGTPFDFTRSKRIGCDLYADNDQLRWNRGYNHCYVLKKQESREDIADASLWDEMSGRRLDMVTDLPGLLLYTGGFYKEPERAVCLETQFYPDTPSHPDFPSCLLHEGELYDHYTSFKFRIEKSE